MYHSQCACASNGSRELTLTIYSSVNVFIALGYHSENDYGLTYEYTYQDCEYILWILCMLYIQLVTKPYTCGFPAPGYKCDWTLSFWAHLWSGCLGNASQLYANKSHLNTAWRPCEVRWLFSRTVCAMTLLMDFTAKPTHSHAVFTLWVYTYTNPPPLSHPFCSHWTNLPSTMLKVTSLIVLTHTMYAIAFKAAWWVMQTLEVWADTKLSWDISRLFEDYLV